YCLLTRFNLFVTVIGTVCEGGPVRANSTASSALSARPSLRSRSNSSALSALVLALPVANAVAAAKTHAATLVVPRKKILTKKVTGPSAQAHRWGYVEVVLTIKKTTATIGTHKKITRRITEISIPIYPTTPTDPSTSATRRFRI